LSKRELFIKICGLILAIAVFQVVGIELLLYYTWDVTAEEFLGSFLRPWWIIVVFVIIYLFLANYYAYPVFGFLDKLNSSQDMSIERISFVQDRLVNFPVFLAVILYPFYFSGTVLGAWINLSYLGLPLSKLAYGVLAGIIAPVWATPMAIFAGNWICGQVLSLPLPEHWNVPPARLAGRTVGVRGKLMLMIMALVAAPLGYLAVIGYSMSSGGSVWIFFALLWVVSLIVTFLLAWGAGTMITRPLEELKAVTERVREGEYDRPVKIIGNDELALLGQTVNLMMETITSHVGSMEAVMDKLRDGIEKLDGASETLLAVSSQQSSGASQQASAVQESSSVAEEIVAMAGQISERAKGVGEAADNTLSLCREGEHKLAGAREEFQDIEQQSIAIEEAMQQLETRFEEIFKVVELMEEIADQTELLALNASLEAAGAGAQGRRFFVVAEETGRLAGRAGQATGDIRTLVESIRETVQESTGAVRMGNKKVAEGGSVIEDVGKSILDISGAAESTSSSVREIQNSTAQQTSATEQLASSISEVKEVAGQVDESARKIQTAISELRDLAQTLRATMQ